MCRRAGYEGKSLILVVMLWFPVNFVSSGVAEYAGRRERCAEGSFCAVGLRAPVHGEV